MFTRGRPFSLCLIGRCHDSVPVGDSSLECGQVNLLKEKPARDECAGLGGPTFRPADDFHVPPSPSCSRQGPRRTAQARLGRGSRAGAWAVSGWSWRSRRSPAGTGRGQRADLAGVRPPPGADLLELGPDLLGDRTSALCARPASVGTLRGSRSVDNGALSPPFSTETARTKDMATGAGSGPSGRGADHRQQLPGQQTDGRNFATARIGRRAIRALASTVGSAIARMAVILFSGSWSGAGGSCGGRTGSPGRFRKGRPYRP